MTLPEYVAVIDSREWMEHPDGHPKLPTDPHHELGHVHATNIKGEEAIFTYPAK
jgi:hypothetical protein